MVSYIMLRFWFEFLFAYTVWPHLLFSKLAKQEQNLEMSLYTFNWKWYTNLATKIQYKERIDTEDVCWQSLKKWLNSIFKDNCLCQSASCCLIVSEKLTCACFPMLHSEPYTITYHTAPDHHPSIFLCFKNVHLVYLAFCRVVGCTVWIIVLHLFFPSGTKVIFG